MRVAFCSHSFEGLQGFNFVIDCLWPEFYEAVVGNLDSIFAQGNPALFHKVLYILWAVLL